MQQPQYIMGTCNMSLTTCQDKAQCQEICRIAIDIINLPDEGGMQGCNCRCRLKSLDRAMANITAAALGTKSGSRKES